MLLLFVFISSFIRFLYSSRKEPFPYSKMVEYSSCSDCRAFSKYFAESGWLSIFLAHWKADVVANVALGTSRYDPNSVAPFVLGLQHHERQSYQGDARHRVQVHPCKLTQ
jgi:hypothetical protein